jgi:hypothetical protein
MLGKVFALCTDEEQAQFINEAGKALRRVCTLADGAGEDMQLMRIADRLDMNGKRFIKRLAELSGDAPW